MDQNTQRTIPSSEKGEARLIGSPFYHADFLSLDLSPKKKALLPLQQLGAFLDEQGILQLSPVAEYAFYPGLSPHSAFWEDYAAMVRQGFPEGLSAEFSDSYARRLIHQFRMYIDRCNLSYVRRTYGAGSTSDLAALMAYEGDLKRQGLPGLYFDEPSRYHNKLYGTEVYRQQINDKIETANRHGEFIVNLKTGRFVSQWEVFFRGEDGLFHLPEFPTVEEQRQILDSESFNYATGRQHYLFDVLPARADLRFSLDYPCKQQLKAGTDWSDIPKPRYREQLGMAAYAKLRQAFTDQIPE